MCSSTPRIGGIRAHILLEAFAHTKDVVLMNAEIDATIGPILQVYAAKHGVVLSACDGDEPGIQVNLYRWPRTRPDAAGDGQHQGLQDPYRNPTTQKDSPSSGGRTPPW